MSPTSPTPLNGGALAEAVRGGQHSLGTFIGMATPVSAEVCAASGFDWVLLDLEHGAAARSRSATWSPPQAATESRRRSGRGRRTDRIGRVLDNGAAGIMLPRSTVPLR